MRGRGNFGQFLKKAFSGVFGDNFGADLGRGVQKVIRNVLGSGDYTIRRNSIIEHLPVGPDGELTKEFSFSNFGAATVRCKKREYVGNVVAPASSPENFTQLSYRLQATNGTTFPWLSNIAKLFTEWELKGAIVSFETTSSNYSATVGLGTIAIATQYNANMLPYANMDQILQSAYHTRGNPAENMLHGIECDPELQASKRLYTRRPGASGPPNLYDHGVLYVATEGLPSGSAGVTLGRIYITYDVELSLPELPVVSPWQNDLGKSAVMASAAGAPPLGATLSITADASALPSAMTIAVTPGSNIMLLAPAAGPLTKPTLNPVDESELCAWMNDNSGAATEQFLSFARAGNYALSIVAADAGGAPYEDADTVCTAHTDTVITDRFFNDMSSATDQGATWIWQIEVTSANGSVTLNDAGGVTDSKFFTIVRLAD